MPERSKKGKLARPAQVLCMLAAAALLPTIPASGTVLDFTNADPPPEGPGYGGIGTINGAIFTTIDTLPAGTGVFDPFLTYQKKGTEEGYNTSQGGNGQGFLDTKRVEQWTHDLHVGDLTVVPGPDGTGSYYAFELDANETGTGNINRYLSIDDIRIYTSATDTALDVRNNQNAIDSLGTLRYAQNATLGVTDNWVLIDASRSEGGSTSGSGSSDLIVYVPVSAFAGARPEDFLYFYSKNGVHDEAAAGSESDAGYEEWRTVIAVPDGGNTLLLLGASLTAVGLLRRRLVSNT